MPNGALQGAAPGAAADGPTAVRAMTTDPLAGQPMAQPHNGVLLPVADIGPNPNPPSPVPPASPVPVLANPAAAALDSPTVPDRGAGSAGGAHPDPARCDMEKKYYCFHLGLSSGSRITMRRVGSPHYLSQTTSNCLRRPQTSELQSACVKWWPQHHLSLHLLHATWPFQHRSRKWEPACARLETGEAANSAPGVGGAAPANAARSAARAGATDAPRERADAAEGSARIAASAAAASGADVGVRGIFAYSREALLEPAERAAQAAGPSVSVVAEPMAVGNSPGDQTGGGVQVGSEHQRAAGPAGGVGVEAMIGAGSQGSGPGIGEAAAGTPADPSLGSLPSPGSRGASERKGRD